MNGEDPLETLFERAVVLHQTGLPREAADVYAQILARNPHHGKALHLGGLALHQLGRHKEAETLLRAAMAAGANDIEARVTLGDALIDLRRFEEARVELQGALGTDPGHAWARHLLGEALRGCGRLDDAVSAWRKSVELNPALAEAHFSLGTTLSGFGKADDALIHLGKAREILPQSAQIHSNLLMAMQYAPAVDQAGMFEEHLRWSAAHAPKPPPPPPLANPDPERPLNVGFVSDDFRFHAVGHFFLRPLKARTAERWRAVLYSNVKNPDRVTREFSAAADAFRDVSECDDDALLRFIKEDRIDILIDLNGHTKGNRLTAFARRAAPVQATWLDYVDTTGMKAMDYIIADRFLIPEENEAFYAETVLRLPNDCLCYSAPDYAPPVASPPALKNGFVRFCSFNPVHKASPETVAAWCRVLMRVPTAGFLMNSPELAHKAVREHFLGLFEEGGVDPSRIELSQGGPHEVFLAAYGNADIVLDTFPFSGGLNTCEALWMGLPVVTCPGERQSSRLATSHLSNAGLEGFIARDLDDYVDKAVALAADIPALCETRKTLRSKMAASPLCDVPRYVTDFTQVLRTMWRRACEGDPHGGR